ncbi:hypothetical protein TPAU25S_03284 [Tsukamurella paurometabola]
MPSRSGAPNGSHRSRWQPMRRACRSPCTRSAIEPARSPSTSWRSAPALQQVRQANRAIDSSTSRPSPTARSRVWRRWESSRLCNRCTVIRRSWTTGKQSWGWSEGAGIPVAEVPRRRRPHRIGHRCADRPARSAGQPVHRADRRIGSRAHPASVPPRARLHPRRGAASAHRGGAYAGRIDTAAGASAGGCKRTSSCSTSTCSKRILENSSTRQSAPPTFSARSPTRVPPPPGAAPSLNG